MIATYRKGKWAQIDGIDGLVAGMKSPLEQLAIALSRLDAVEAELECLADALHGVFCLLDEEGKKKAVSTSENSEDTA